MADFQSGFEDATNGINDIVNTQVSKTQTWRDISGNLKKVSTSAGGFIWGYNQDNQLLRCALPCTGKWTRVDLSKYNVKTIFDIATDVSHVYVLVAAEPGGKLVLTSPVSSMDEWIPINVFSEAVNIFPTHTFIWAQDSSTIKQRCAKPCVTGGWISSTDVAGRITSSSETALYGVDKKGVGVKSDETLQSGWTPVAAFAGKVLTALLGQLDKNSLYALENNKLLRNEGDQTNIVNTFGQTPMQVSPDPLTNNVWMTTSGIGKIGNVFSKADRPDYSTIINMVTPLDQKRNKLIEDAETQYVAQDKITKLNASLSDFTDYMSARFSGLTGSSDAIDQKTGQLQTYIEKTNNDIEKMKKVQPTIKILLYILLAVFFIYLLGGFLGKLVHVVAFAVLVGGLVYASTIKNGIDDSANPTNG